MTVHDFLKMVELAGYRVPGIHNSTIQYAWKRICNSFDGYDIVPVGQPIRKATDFYLSCGDGSLQSVAGVSHIKDGEIRSSDSAIFLRPVAVSSTVSAPAPAVQDSEGDRMMNFFFGKRGTV